MRIAVTGASGFIGRHTVARFTSRGDTAISVPRPFVPETLAQTFANVDAVVHLAGVVTAKDEDEYVDANVTSTRIVAEAARAAGVRLVHVSSLAVAGPAPPTAPHVESDPPAPITTYGRTKLEGERSVTTTAGLQWTVLRPGVVYGPGDRALVPLFGMARSGFLPLVGRATAAYTFIYIDEMVDAIAAAVDRARVGATIFVGHPTPVTPRALVEGVRDATGGRASIVRVPLPFLRVAAWGGDAFAAVTGRGAAINSRRFVEIDAPGFVCRVDRLRQDLGVEPKVDLAAGLHRAAAWYLSQL
jgi:nucleoside-diphosphate-sugar epimerase